MCLPAVAAVASAGSGILGAVGSHQQAQAQADYQNESARRNYDYANKQRALDWQNQLSVWGVKRNEYQHQVSENFSAADRAYASEQDRLNEQFKAAAFMKQDLMSQLVGGLGSNRAREVSGRSAGRMDTAMLSAFGRNQAVMTANLVSARSAMIQRNYDTHLQLGAANRRAYNNVAVAPVAGVAPPPPQMVAGPSGLGLAAGILGGVASGIGAFNSLKAPSAGSFGNNNQGGIPGISGPSGWSGNTSYANVSNLNPLGSSLGSSNWGGWTPGNTFNASKLNWQL